MSKTSRSGFAMSVDGNKSVVARPTDVLRLVEDDTAALLSIWATCPRYAPHFPLRSLDEDSALRLNAKDAKVLAEVRRGKMPLLPLR